VLLLVKSKGEIYRKSGLGKGRYMSMKTFYYKLGNQSLNISLFFTMISIIILLILAEHNQPLAACFLLLSLSIFYYMIHLYYFKKSVRLNVKKGYNDGKSGLDVFLIEKASSYTYFFQPNGIANIKIQRKHTLKGLYLIYFENNRVMFMNIRKENDRSITITFNDGKVIVRIDPKGKENIIGEIIFPQNRFKIKRLPNREIVFYNKYRQLAVNKRGWLPLDWISLFRLNTPVVTFQEKLTSTERAAILLALVWIER